jgi:hypothetical protein
MAGTLSQFVQSDFVQKRKTSSLTQDDLVLRMSIAR